MAAPSLSTSQLGSVWGLGDGFHGCCLGNPTSCFRLFVSTNRSLFCWQANPHDGFGVGKNRRVPKVNVGTDEPRPQKTGSVSSKSPRAHLPSSADADLISCTPRLVLAPCLI